MAPPDDKKSPALKAPAAKVETINLKVFIHCEGCKRKVKKILSEIEGVESVDIDANLGKVTVIGIVDPKVLLKKLEKKGKVAEVVIVNGSKGKVTEVLNASGGKEKEKQKDQPKGDPNKKPKKVRFQEAEGDTKSKGGGGEVDKKSKGGGGNGDGVSANSDGGKKSNYGGDASGSNGAAHTGQDEKKKKGGDAGFDEFGPSNNTAHKSVTPRMIETGFSVESADYATHIFSDENTGSCHIM